MSKSLFGGGGTTQLSELSGGIGSSIRIRAANSSGDDGWFSDDTLAEYIRDTIAAALTAGSNITITPSDGSDIITIAASGGGSADRLEGVIIKGTGEYIGPADAGFANAGAGSDDVANKLYMHYFNDDCVLSHISTDCYTSVASTLGKLCLVLADGPGLTPKTLVEGFNTGADMSVTGTKDFALASNFVSKTSAPNGFYIGYVANGATKRQALGVSTALQRISRSSMRGSSNVPARMVLDLNYATAFPSDFTTLGTLDMGTNAQSGSPGVVAGKVVQV